MATLKSNSRLGISPVCSSMVACDGITVTNGKDICARCLKALAKRNAPPKPLRGEYLSATMDIKKKKL